MAAALKERTGDDRDDEIVRLKGKVGEMTMETELLREKIARLEAGCAHLALLTRPSADQTAPAAQYL